MFGLLPRPRFFFLLSCVAMMALGLTSCSFNYVSYGAGKPPTKEARKKIYKVNQRKVNASRYGALDQAVDCPAPLLRRPKKRTPNYYH